MREDGYLDSLFQKDVGDFVWEKTGRDRESTHFELNMPKPGEKFDYSMKGFNFSSLSRFCIDKSDILDFMSAQTNKTLEQCHRELNSPPIKKIGNDSFGPFGSIKTFTPGEMGAIRGMPSF